MTDPLVAMVDIDGASAPVLEAVLSTHGYQVGHFVSGSDFLQSSSCLQVGCAIMELLSPADRVTMIQEELQRRQSPLTFIYTTANPNIGLTVEVMKHGAIDVLLKPLTFDRLLQAVQEGVALSHARQLSYERIRHREKVLAQLNEDERDVLSLLVKGLAYKVIAKALSISERSVNRYRCNVLRKTQTETIQELILLLGGEMATVAQSGSATR